MQRNPFELAEKLREKFGTDLQDVSLAFGEVTAVVPLSSYREGYGNSGMEVPDKRFAVVVHLLSLTFNGRLRVRVFAEDEKMPEVPSVSDIWPSANWFEREAFDLYGILFSGHPDLRRILTDYGFVGHPFRKDFPVQGYVEMRYDEKEKRVVYQPVTIEPREITPRVVRDPDGGDGR